MKHVQTFENFLGVNMNEAVKKETEIIIPKLSNIDSIRLVKWIDQYIDAPNAILKKSGSGWIVNIEKLTGEDISYLKDYIDYLCRGEEWLEVAKAKQKITKK